MLSPTSGNTDSQHFKFDDAEGMTSGNTDSQHFKFDDAEGIYNSIKDVGNDTIMKVRRPGSKVMNFRRGSKYKAFGAAKSHASKREAMKKLQDLYYTAGTKAMMTAAWSTWTSCHRSWKSTNETMARVGNLEFEIAIRRELVDDDVKRITDSVDQIISHGTIRISGYIKSHKVVIGPPATPVKWKTRCGKRVAGLEYATLTDLGNVRRGQCFA